MNVHGLTPTASSSEPSIPDFQLGRLLVSPSRRLFDGPSGRAHLPPLVMAVFLCLATQVDRVVSRRSLFDQCWGNAPVGDDSLNRALSAVRHALEKVGATELSVETVPRTGYRLALAAERAEAAGDAPDDLADNAFDCWRAGLPQPDLEVIEALDGRLQRHSGRAGEWGILALLLRKAVEYAGAADCAALVGRCEKAARRALALDAAEGNARVALAGVAPLFGNWVDVRQRLDAVLESDPSHVAARHDLAVLEMASGRVRAAVPLIERLSAEDGLTATFHYKRMYHLWTIGDLQGADRVALRALTLWPLHPAIWVARFWILVFTGRADQALAFAAAHGTPPNLPPPATDFLLATARLVRDRQQGAARSDLQASHVQRALTAAALGPANAVSALLALCALDELDAAFAVARAYYIGEGPAAVPPRWSNGESSITDQHRRITQPLFTPAAFALRQDPRFLALCEDMGLASYWETAGVIPDFLEG